MINCTNRSRALFAVLLLSLVFNSWANGVVNYQDWYVDSGADVTEAYTHNKDQATFGFFCKEDTCIYYISHNNGAQACPIGTKNLVLMTSGETSSAFMMTCTNLSGRTFQILDDPVAVGNAVKSGGQIGFSAALPGGNFIITTFSLNNAPAAIERAIREAKQKKLQPKTPNSTLNNI